MKFDSIDSVIDEIKKYSKVPDWVVSARFYHKDMKALMYGDGFKSLLLKIEHIESDKKALARLKYSRPIKDINSKILEPVNNVYSATGGSKHYNITNEANKKTLLKTLGNVRGGLSLEQWLQTYWSKDLYNIDPSGLMMLEWKDDKAWPTYKSIDTIRYYKANGMSVEYVIFEPINDDDDLIWRVVDDANDYTIKQSGDVFSLVENETFNNPFYKCPARVISDKIQLGTDYRIAPLDTVIDTEKELLRDRSILTIYKFLNGFATPYKPKIICPSCHGTKKNGIEACPDCDGKGVVLDKDVTDEIILPIKLDAENQIQLPSDFAGFISPPLEIWDQYINEGKRLFNEIFETIWGTRESEVKDQTAMGVMMNTQPMISRLDSWSNVAQSHEHSFTEMLANFVMNTENAESVSVISYGRNYIIQPPEFLLKEYQESNEKKDPITIRDRKLSEYLTSKYKNDPQTLRVELLKKDLEPYIHYDIEVINDIYGNQEAQKKGLFTDWWESLTSKDKDKTKEQLETMRNEWFNNNMAILPQQATIQL